MKKRGTKLRYSIEQALIDLMEDKFDLEAYNERRNEETIPFEDILDGLDEDKS